LTSSTVVEELEESVSRCNEKGVFDLDGFVGVFRMSIRDCFRVGPGASRIFGESRKWFIVVYTIGRLKLSEFIILQFKVSFSIIFSF